MIKSRIAIAGALLTAAGAVNAAGFSVTPTIATDYDFRGISQTNPDQENFDPAFQVGANYSLEDGIYAGIWGSNVDFDFGGAKDLKPDWELDYTLGFAGGDAAESFGYDVGLVYYTYVAVGHFNTWEGFAGISKQLGGGTYSGKLWYSPDYFSTKNSGFYLEGNVAYPIPMDFTLLAHVGFADMEKSKSATDYSIGVAKTLGNFVFNAKYIDGSTNNAYDYDGRFVFSISTTVPWGAE